MGSDGQNVLVTLPTNLHELVCPVYEERFSAANIRWRITESEFMVPRDQFIAEIANADGHIVGLEVVDKEVLQAAARIKVVCKFGVGTDNIDGSAARARGVAVTNCPGVNSQAVAELAVGLMLSMARDLVPLDREMKARVWTAAVGTELSGKTVGIVGLGNIGKSLVRLLQGFRNRILAYEDVRDTAFAREYNVSYVSLEQLLKECDFLTLHVPLTAQTRNMINAEMLALMKPGAMILNLARGGVVDEKALLAAVDSGAIRSAALDAFAVEPPFGNAIVESGRIITLPHIGASTEEAIVRVAQMTADNVIAVLSGAKPQNVVN